MSKSIVIIRAVLLVGLAAAFFYQFKLTEEDKKAASLREIEQNTPHGTLPEKLLLSAANPQCLAEKLQQNPSRKKVLVLFFSACEGCVDEIRKMKKRATQNKQYWYILVSSEDANTLAAFREQHQLNDDENFCLLQVSDENLRKIFKRETYPTLLLYDEKNKFVKQLVGLTEVK